MHNVRFIAWFKSDTCLSPAFNSLHLYPFQQAATMPLQINILYTGRKERHHGSVANTLVQQNCRGPSAKWQGRTHTTGIRQGCANAHRVPWKGPRSDHRRGTQSILPPPKKRGPVGPQYLANRLLRNQVLLSPCRQA